MLTGTLVTVSGFLPIALAKSGTGEYTRSIFEVSAIALAAVVAGGRRGHSAAGLSDLSEHPTRRAFGFHKDAERDADAARSDAARCLRHEILPAPARLDQLVRRPPRTGARSDAGLFVVGLAGFKLIPQQFFPSSDRTELLVDLRLPEGASFSATLREVQRFEATLKQRPEIDHFIDFVGAGAPRFYLPLDQQLSRRTSRSSW
jgi:multidrug efflux pump